MRTLRMPEVRRNAYNILIEIPQIRTIFISFGVT
jgi:hypothetical protein